MQNKYMFMIFVMLCTLFSSHDTKNEECTDYNFISGKIMQLLKKYHSTDKKEEKEEVANEIKKYEDYKAKIYDSYREFNDTVTLDEQNADIESNVWEKNKQIKK